MISKRVTVIKGITEREISRRKQKIVNMNWVVLQL